MPRRVLHVMNAASGGAALSTMELVRGLEARGITSAIVCNPAGAADDRARLIDAVCGRVLFTPLYLWNRKLRAATWKRPLLALWLGGRTGFARASALQVARFAAEQRSDLIHTNTFTTPEGGLAARWLGLPHVWHLRELIGPGHPFRLTREGPALASWLETHCSRVVANSATSARTLAGWVPEGFIDVVPNGVDLARFTGLPARSPGAPIIIGVVANLTSRTKQHALAIDAARLLPRDLAWELRFIGEGSRSDAYVDGLHARAEASGVSDRIRFTGRAPGPVDAMAGLDVLLHPADNESFGRVAIEAMAAGLPVVGVRKGGIAEIVVEGRTGLLAEPGNAVGLAAALAKLLLDPALRAELGAAGRTRAEAVYSQQAILAGILSAYAAAQPLRPILGLSLLPALTRLAAKELP